MTPSCERCGRARVLEVPHVLMICPLCKRPFSLDEIEVLLEEVNCLEGEPGRQRRHELTRVIFGVLRSVQEALARSVQLSTEHEQQVASQLSKFQALIVSLQSVFETAARVRDGTTYGLRSTELQELLDALDVVVRTHSRMWTAS